MRALIQSKPLSIAHASLRIQSYSYLRSADARPSSSFKVNAARRRQRGSTDTESPPPVDTAAMAPQASSKQRQKSSGTTKNLQGPPTAAPSGSTDHLAGGAASKAQAPPPTQPAAAAHTTPEALASAQKEDQLQKAPRAKPTPTHPPTRAKEQELWDQVRLGGLAHMFACVQALLQWTLEVATKPQAVLQLQCIKQSALIWSACALVVSFWSRCQGEFVYAPRGQINCQEISSFGELLQVSCGCQLSAAAPLSAYV